MNNEICKNDFCNNNGKNVWRGFCQKCYDQDELEWIGHVLSTCDMLNCTPSELLKTDYQKELNFAKRGENI